MERVRVSCTKKREEVADMPELAFVEIFELTIKYIEIALPGATSQSTQIVSRSDSHHRC